LPDARRLWVAALIIAAMVLLYVVALPGLLPSLVGITFTSKLLVSALLLIPLGLIMGMPFPTGLRAMAANVEWAWAMNAASSVLGSVIAMFIAIQWGLRATLLCAAAAYVLAALLSRSLAQSARTESPS
jgi:hypothetical protein